MQNFSLYIPYLIGISLISLIDFLVVIRTRFITKHTVHPKVKPNEDFTILIPIFGNMKYLRNIEFLEPYAKHVILCTTTRESAEFNRDIERISKKYGFRIFRSEVALATKRHKPNPWKLFSNTLVGNRKEESTEDAILSGEARDEIIRDSFAAVDTKYCIFIDGDTTAEENLNKLAGLIEEKGFDIASVRVLASKTDTIMEKLQDVEYKLAMDARRIYPWLTSGAAMIAKTEVIRDIMSHHSLFFSGGDIEIGKLASILNYKVGHLTFEFYTDVPDTFKAWFKQRMAWFGGGFRHAVVNMHQFTWRRPLFFLYTTFLVYLLTPLRLYEAITHPLVIPVVIVIYWILIFAFHIRSVRWFYALFPFYSLIQIMVLVPLGFYTYLKMVAHSKNWGIIKLRPNRQNVA
jgi:hypothetical protein